MRQMLLIAGVKWSRSGSGAIRRSEARRTIRKPEAVSARRRPESRRRMPAKIRLPSLRTGGILLCGFIRFASTTSAPVSRSRFRSGTEKSGSQVPSASMKPSRSASAAFQPALIAAPYPRFRSKRTFTTSANSGWSTISCVRSVHPSFTKTMVMDRTGVCSRIFLRAARHRRRMAAIASSSFSAGTTSAYRIRLRPPEFDQVCPPDRRLQRDPGRAPGRHPIRLSAGRRRIGRNPGAPKRPPGPRSRRGAAPGGRGSGCGLAGLGRGERSG